jgi:hypothetical protein
LFRVNSLFSINSYAELTLFYKIKLKEKRLKNDPFRCLKAVSPTLIYNHRCYAIMRSLTAEAARTLDIGADFRPHQQTVCYCRSEQDEVQQTSLQ